MNWFRRAVSSGRKIAMDSMGEEILYYLAGDNVSITISAIAGQRRTEDYTENNTLVDRQLQDWIVDTSALPRLPRRNDVIEFEGKRYRVTHPGGGREYDAHDVFSDSLRIHTIEINASVPLPGEAGNTYAPPGSDVYGSSDDEYGGPPR